MIEAGAVVERVDGAHVWVRIQGRVGGCGRCDEPGGCRSTGIAYAFGSPERLFRLPNEIGARAGDPVQLQMADGAALRGALFSYGVGVLLLIVGALIGHALAPARWGDFAALVGGAAGLLVAVIANRAMLRSAGLRAGFAIRMAPARPCLRHAADEM